MLTILVEEMTDNAFKSQGKKIISLMLQTMDIQNMERHGQEGGEGETGNEEVGQTNPLMLLSEIYF